MNKTNWGDIIGSANRRIGLKIGLNNINEIVVKHYSIVLIKNFLNLGTTNFIFVKCKKLTKNLRGKLYVNLKVKCTYARRFFFHVSAFRLDSNGTKSAGSWLGQFL